MCFKQSGLRTVAVMSPINIYPLLLRLGLGLSGGAAQVVVVVTPADHLVPLLGARLGAVRALLRRDDLEEKVYFLCLYFLFLCLH